MNTRELIQKLQEADPSGNLPVTFGGGTIFGAYKIGAYYDGPYQQLDVTEDGVTSAKYVFKGDKVVILSMNIEDAIYDDPDLLVDFTEVQETRGEEATNYMVEQVEGWRHESRLLESRIEEM
jgi:hypothetical protein